MPDRQHTDLVPRDDEPVQRYVSGLPEGNYELANVAVYATPEQRVRGQVLDGRTDSAGCRDGRVRILARQQFKGGLEVRESPCRVDYRRHGFGRAAS